MNKNEEKLKNEVRKAFCDRYFVSPEEMGLNSMMVADFGLITKQKQAIFAKDEEAAQAYAKEQGYLHKVWQSALIVMLIAAFGVIPGFLQLIKGNLVPFIMLAAMCFIAAFVYMTGYFKHKPLHKKYLDDEGRLKVLTFYLDKNGKWQPGLHDPEFVAKHVHFDED